MGVGRDAPIPKTDKLQLAWHKLAVLIQPVPQNWETQRSNKEVKRQARPVKTPSGILYDNQGARPNRRVSQEEGKTGKDVGTHGYIRKQGPLAEFEYWEFVLPCEHAHFCWWCLTGTKSQVLVVQRLQPPKKELTRVLNKHSCKQSYLSSHTFELKIRCHFLSRKQSERTRKDCKWRNQVGISPKKTSKWLLSLWKGIQHLWKLGKCGSKPGEDKMAVTRTKRKKRESVQIWRKWGRHHLQGCKLVTPRNIKAPQWNWKPNNSCGPADFWPVYRSETSLLIATLFTIVKTCYDPWMNKETVRT